MLHKDKSKRYSIQECLDHSWFVQNHPSPVIQFNPKEKSEALVCLQSYQKLTKLFKAIRLINVKLGKNCKNLQDLRNLFMS